MEAETLSDLDSIGQDSKDKGGGRKSTGFKGSRKKGKG